MIKYNPEPGTLPKRVADVPSAWVGLESILPSIIADFAVSTGKAIEFGVDCGYSAVALSNYFSKVVAVDSFIGNLLENTNEEDKQKSSEIAKEACDYENINLVIADFEDFEANESFDLAHVDILHEYEPTYNCGKKSCELAPVVLFHDTVTYPAVARACDQLSKETGRFFYNYPHCHGLGILSVNEKI